MSSIRENALVLRTRNYGEKNRVAVLLTENHGVISAFVNGARSLNSRNAAATSQFVYGSYLLTESKENYTVKESQPEANYGDMGADIEALALAQYFCELCMELAPENTPAAEYLRLLRGALHYLSSAGRDKRLIKSAFEMRILTISGFMPDIVMCSSCGAYEAEKMMFYPASGTITCGKCDNGTGGIALSSGALTALRHCVLADMKKLFSFAVSDEALDSLGKASERYLLACLDRSFKALEFYRSLRIN